MSVKLSDGRLETPYTLEIDIRNSPPRFDNDLDEIELEAKETLTFTFPETIDDNNDVVEIIPDIGNIE